MKKSGWKRALMAGFGFILFGIPCVLDAQQTGTEFSGAPEKKEYQGIPYLSGGVGTGEREALRELSLPYNLKMVFATEGGYALGHVDVTVRSTEGKEVLDVVSDGPWFYTLLPEGRYLVTAESEGRKLEKNVRVGGEGERSELFFFWSYRPE